MAREYQGWSLTEIKSLTRRERTYWLDLMKWRREKNGNGA